MDWYAVASLAADLCSEPMFLVGRDRRIELVNAAMEQLVGIDRYRLVEEDWLHLFSNCVSEDAQQRAFNDALRGVLRTTVCRLQTAAGDEIELEMDLVATGEDEDRSILAVVRGAGSVARGTALISSGSEPSGEGVGADAYEVLVDAEHFGTLVSHSSFDFQSTPSVDSRCFSLIHSRTSPCPGCPLQASDSEPWPRNAVFPPTDDEDEYRIIVAERPIDGVARVSVQSITGAMFTSLLHARVESLAREAGLTGREREVLGLLLLGRGLSDIAAALGIAPRTAKFHQANILNKLGADSRFELFRLLL